MRRIPGSRLLRLSLLAAAALLCVAGSLWAQSPAGKTGTKWEDVTLQQALDEAKASDKMLMIDFWAGHCGQCAVMTNELWDTEDGAKLTADVIAIKIDTTTPAGQEAADRYPLTGLPCVLFIRPDGTEIDRVEGYMNKQEFLYKITPIKGGVDPLPGMEAALKDHPDSPQLMLDVMERYMWRKRGADVDTLFNRIIRLDPQNQKQFAEKAILKMGRYTELILHDQQKTVDNWKMMAERFPTSISIGAAIDGAWTAWANMGRYQDWLDWVCPLLDKNPNQQMMQRAAVAIGYRGGYQSPCLAKAARVVRPTVPTRGAWYDSVAVYFEGKGPKPK